MNDHGSGMGGHGLSWKIIALPWVAMALPCGIMDNHSIAMNDHGSGMGCHGQLR